VKKWFLVGTSLFLFPAYGVMEIHSRNNILISAPTGATKTSHLSLNLKRACRSQKRNFERQDLLRLLSPLKALNNDISKNLTEPCGDGKACRKRISIELE
jgi:Lhr-like helicase